MTDTFQPLPRCCPVHRDWTTLAEHLCEEFSEVPIRAVLREIVEARTTIEEFRVKQREALEVGELMVRHRLMLMTGLVSDSARTDPQVHASPDTSEFDDELDPEDEGAAALAVGG